MKAQNKVKISAKQASELDDRYFLAELSLGNRLQIASREFHLKEAKGSKTASLFLSDGVFDFQGTCNCEEQGERHALGFLQDDRLQLVELPLYFPLGKRVKTEPPSGPQRKGSLNYQEKKELIVQEIGTAKSRKILKHQRTRLIDDQKIRAIDEIKEIFNEKAVVLQGEDQENEGQAQKTSAQKLRALLPNFSDSAKTPEKMFSIESVISEKDFQQIQAQGFVDSADRGGLNKAVYVILAQTKTELMSLGSEELKAWCYLNHLFSVFPIKRISKSPKELAKEKRVPLGLLLQMLKNFYEPIGANTEAQEFIQTKLSSLKFVAHIVVLLLVLNKGRFEVDSVFPFMRMHEKEWGD